MASEAQRSDIPDDTAGDPFVRDQLAAIDGDLMRGMPADARFESGVPEGQRAGALDFIQMTGLTRPAPQRPRQQTRFQDVDSSEPLSFYEAGVTDVDDRMESGQLESRLRDASLDADLIPDRASEPLGAGESASVRAFRDIIAELESGGVDEDVSETESAYDDSPGDDADAEESFQSLADDLATETTYDADATSVAPDVLEDLLETPEAPSAEAPDELPAEEPVAPSAEPEVQPPSSSEPTPSDTDDFDALVASLASSNASAPQEDTADLSEDWDALLDSVSQEEKSAPADSNDGNRRNSAPLEEAGQLMTTLGASTSAKSLVPAPTVEAAEGVDPALAYDYGAAPTRRRSRRHSRIARRGWRIVKLALLFAVVAGAGAALWYFTLAPWIEQPEDLEAHADRLLSERRYADASAAYLRLSDRPSADSASAQFQAAHVLTLGVAGLPRDSVTARFEGAKKIFNDFIAENPQHPKKARALCMVGRLEYELGNYDSAITILRDQIRPEDDPAAALAMLRYLARSYVQTNAFDEAETAYLQAATLPGNYNAETDYQELGDMFRTRAGFSGTPVTEVESYKSTAAAYWNKALQVPGIDPGTTKELQERLEWLEFTEKTGAEPETTELSAPSEPVEAPAMAMPLESEQPEAAASPIPAQDNPGDRVEDPGAALETTGQVLGPLEETPATEDVTTE